MKQSRPSLKYALPELKANPEVVLAAVKQRGYALKYASPELKANPSSCSLPRRRTGALWDLLHGNEHHLGDALS